MGNRKITEVEMMKFFQEGSLLLKPLVIKKIEKNIALQNRHRADALIVASIQNSNEVYKFIIKVKASSTPLIVAQAVAQAKSFTVYSSTPMIVVPYLSPARLEELENMGVSGIDLCGNGFVNVPGKLYILRTGEKNLYSESRPLSNPYRGRSAMVARLLLVRHSFSSLKKLLKVLGDSGEKMVISQVSKAVQALADDLVVSKVDGKIFLADPFKLLENLAFHWKEKVGKSKLRKGVGLKLKDGVNSLSVLSKDSSIRWVVTGESSVNRYTAFSQGGSLKVVVSDIDIALRLLDEAGVATQESIKNFADVVLYETDEPGFFFDRITDASRINWAGKVQTYIELANGDARQQEAADDIKKQIINEVDQ